MNTCTLLKFPVRQSHRVTIINLKFLNNQMRFSVLPGLLLVIITSALFISCDTEDPFAFREPDLSTVPEPFEFEETEPVLIEEGIEAYILDEGSGFETIVPRDRISVSVSIRTMDGEIVYSTFINGSTQPVNILVNSIKPENTNPNSILSGNLGASAFIDRSFSDGFRKGVLSMKKGERRTLIISPEQGFANVSQSNPNFEYRDDTLQYDVIITNILQQ